MALSDVDWDDPEVRKWTRDIVYPTFPSTTFPQESKVTNSQGYLIAFGGKPLKSFLETVISLSRNDKVEILGAIVTPGPGCYNLAVLLEAPNENYINALTMALMPAKWTTTTDPRLQRGEFVDETQS